MDTLSNVVAPVLAAIIILLVTYIASTWRILAGLPFRMDRFESEVKERMDTLENQLRRIEYNTKSSG